MSRWLSLTLGVALAASVPSSPVAAQASFAAQFPARILAAHNRERALVGAPPLSWDPALAMGAVAYAQQMATTGITQHSDRKGRPGIGESLWWGPHNGYSVEAMVGLWAAEKAKFFPGIYPNNSRTGNWMDVSHYTQLIWPTTTKVGCGLATNGRMDYLVCRYSPKGNVDNRWVGRTAR